MRLRSLARVAAPLAVTVGALVAVPGATAAVVTHKFFPLEPGTTFNYRSTDGKVTHVKVLDKTRRIQGHRSQRVETTEFEGGKLTERFNDWYFQGEKGIVYYMKHTSLRSNENWEAGQDGARTGIYLPADPQVGDTWKRTRAPNAGREGRDRATVYSLSDKTLKIKVDSYANLYPETVRFWYTKNVGLTTIKDKGETTTLKSVGKPSSKR